MILSEAIAAIRDWSNYQQDSDALITSQIRMSEQGLSTSLRIDHQVVVSLGDITLGRVLMPTDWQATDFVRFPNGAEIEYRTRSQFYALAENKRSGYYTTVGRSIVLGDYSEDGEQVELHYFASVPPLTEDGSTWLVDNFLNLFIFNVLSLNYAYHEDEERAVALAGLVAKEVENLNNEYKSRMPSGGVLRRGSSGKRGLFG